MINFDQKFDKNNFLKFLDFFLPDDFKKSDEEYKLAETDDLFERANLLGIVKSLNNLPVFEIIRIKPENSRVKITKRLFKFLEIHGFSHALILTHSVHESHYRFSLITSKLGWASEKKVEKKFSDPKRLSFLLGNNTSVHTATKNLIKAGKVKNFDDLYSRFNIEIVNKEFFDHYKNLYLDLKNKLNKDKEFKLFSKKINLEIDFFAKKLLGQIIFCYFLQKKGWLGVKENKSFGTGDKSFLRNKFFEYEERKENFFNNFLEYFFYKGLNKKNNNDYVREIKCRVPYVGGSLFEYYDDYDWEKESLKISNSTFSNNNKTGILDIFDLYNFTVDEREEMDIEISIDPEMLGNVFENLLDEYIRGNRGTYYTPRDVVEYICKSTLKDFLSNSLNNNVQKYLNEFVFINNFEIDNINELKKNADEIDHLLSNIKVCDPAIGSGAFAVLYLNIVSNLRFKLSKFTSQKYRNTIYDFKRSFIQNCIFGVDVDQYAIEITKLRLWLSLIVDQKKEKEIEPLPNLDFKILQGDSLLDDFKGIDLGPSIHHKDLDQKDLFFATEELINKIKDFAVNQDLFFKCVSFNKKKEIKNNLKKNMLSIIKVLAKDIAQNYKSTNYKDIEEQFDISRARNFFPWGIFFADVFFLNKGFDIIIGNPPYVDSEEMTRSNKDLREVYKKKYQSAKGNWDLYIPFIELGLKLLKENGIISYIVKNTLISSKYSEEIRNILLNFNFLELRDYSTVNVFKEADVYPIVFRLQKSNSKNATIKMTNMKSITDKSIESKINKSDFYKNIYWDCYFSKKKNVEILKKLINQKTFGDNFVSTILSGCTVSEAYKIKEKLKDNSNINKKYFKLINSGTIDPYTSFWGYKKTQYIKDSYDFPIVNKDDLKKISKKRYEISQKEKLIIANMTRGIECFYDYNMEYLAGKSTIVILKGKGGIPLEFLQGILNSKLINFFILIFFNSLKMSGGAINFGPQQLSLVPFPNNKKFLNEISKLVININQLKEKNVDADISSQLFEIDKYIFKSFEIDDGEINQVENFLKEKFQYN